MKKFFSKLKNNKKGYTLTELLVVVAILGVLAAIAIPSVMSAISTSKKQADKTSIQAIETAVEVCIADGTLKMGKDIATGKVDVLNDVDGGQDGKKMGDAVIAKLKGGKLPTPAEDSTQKWKLILRNGQIELATSTTTAQQDTYVILGEK